MRRPFFQTLTSYVLFGVALTPYLFADSQVKDEEAAMIYQKVSNTLEKALNRSSAPESYRSAFQLFQKRSPETQRRIQQNPDQVIEILSQVLKEMNLSHLAIQKRPPLEPSGSLEIEAKPGMLGVHTKPDPSGHDVEKIRILFPNSGLSENGIGRGDQILAVNGRPFSEFQGCADGQSVRVHVRKLNGETEEMDIKCKSRSVIYAPSFQEIDYQGSQVIRLSVPSFEGEYRPEIVAEAFLLAIKKQKDVVVDLRGNPGGRPDHFLSFLLKEGTPIIHEVGKAHELEKTIVAGYLTEPKVHEAMDRYVLRLHDVVSRLNGVLTFPSECRNLQQALQGDFIRLARDQNELIKGLFRFPALQERIRNLFLASQSKIDQLKESLLTEKCPPIDCHRDQPSGKVNLPQGLQQALSPFLPIMTSLDEVKTQIEEGIYKIKSLPLEKPELRDTIRVPSPGQRVPGIGQTLGAITPFRGKIAFLVKDSFCAAEVCAAAPMEYDELRAGQTASESPLYPSAVRVFGSTPGAAQGLYTENFKMESGTYEIRYPGNDIHTPVKDIKVEGQGIQGHERLRKQRKEDGSMDSALIQAIEWLKQKPQEKK
ncbi:MAG: hypothetical protein ACO3A2_06270 [Bdellovibrionia bacterium]